MLLALSLGFGPWRERGALIALTLSLTATNRARAFLANQGWRLGRRCGPLLLDYGSLRQFKFPLICPSTDVYKLQQLVVLFILQSASA